MSMQQSYTNILTAVGEDLNRPGLKDTPMRAAKAFSYLTSGYSKTLEEVTNNAVFPSDNREMVLVKNIEFYSLCEHHLLPFYGRVHIAYLPEGNVLGLSKFARITEMFARRLQIQENLTQQIAEAVAEVTQARGVAVMIDSAHMCMMMRGVGKQESTTRTVSFIGDFKTNKEERREFLSALPENFSSDESLNLHVNSSDYSEFFYLLPFLFSYCCLSTCYLMTVLKVSLSFKFC